MTYAINDEEEARTIRGTEGTSQYILDSNFDREPGQDSRTEQGEPIGADRANGTPRSHVNTARERITGGIIRQLIQEYRDQVAQNKNEITRLEGRISDLEALAEDLRRLEE